MRRSDFFKNLGIGLLASTGIGKAYADVPEVVNHSHVVDVEIKINQKSFEDNFKQSYSDWVYTDLTKFNKYLLDKNYERVQNEFEGRTGGKMIDGVYKIDADGQGPNLYDSLRWFFNRYEGEDINNWQDDLSDYHLLTKVECREKILSLSGNFMKAFPFNNCKDTYFFDWSLNALHKTIYTLAEYYLITDQTDKAIELYSGIEANFIPYTHPEFIYLSNPFQSASYLFNKYNITDQAYRFAVLDQKNRVDGTKSRLLSKLKKAI